MRDPDQPGASGDGDHKACEMLELNPDAAALGADHLERARELGRCLQVEVTIDTTGWLRNEIEVIVRRDPDATLRPVKVRVGADVKDDAVLERGGAVADCDRYNAALTRLRQRAEQLAALVRQGHIRMEPGSPVEYAHRELGRLDELIAHRQRVNMGHGVVRLQTLHREIEFFARCDAHLTPIVLAAERATNTRAPRDRPVAQTRWRWMKRNGARRRS